LEGSNPAADTTGVCKILGEYSGKKTFMPGKIHCRKDSSQKIAINMAKFP
jgi:hypothetical protein